MDERLLTWEFPLPRTHTGALLGNGAQGLMVWGDEALNITVAHAGFWDHRGGNPFTSRTSYAEVRALLEAGDEQGLRRVFAGPERGAGEPGFPTQVGGGRLELRFPGMRPRRATLDLASAVLTVELAGEGGRSALVTVRQAHDRPLALVQLDPEGHGPAEVTLRPTWEWVGGQLAAVGVAPPRPLGGGPAPEGVDERGGFVQELPADDPMALAWARRGAALQIATAHGPGAAERAAALAEGDAGPAWERAGAWWRDSWRDAPRVQLPDPALQEAWDYGVYKLGGLTTPGAVPAALQGPWMEEYQLPPWSNDYHFNINVQMIYMPCLATGRFENLWPLWDLLKGWLPRLWENGRGFFGADDALLMPHAVDDRCQVVGTFWTGMIDQACAAWMGQLAWLHYRYAGDARALAEVAWPLMRGAFGGYWAMLEERGGRLSLPVSVSPEYRGAAMDAWGRDASFQLAALHMLAQTLPEAARALGQPEDPRWARVRAELPPYTLVAPGGGRPRIGLWEGQDLAESHRHHSHLAAIYPFRTLDPADQQHAEAVSESLRHWVATGAGAWSGWCVPWAATLCARCGMPDAAVAWLHWWSDVFTNVGRGTLHNADFPGASVIWGWPRDESGELREIMQMDAGMGAVTAVQELLVQCLGDAIVVLPALPRGWRSLSFDGIWAEGGFRVGATAAGGATQEVRVEATRAGRLRLRHGLGDSWEADGQPGSGPELARDMRAGERITLRRAP